MNKLHPFIAIFYNFKSEQTCPFCRMVRALYDLGGKKLVLERLDLILNENYKHGFAVCFIHHYWLTETYKNKKNIKPLDAIVREGFEIFKGMKLLLSVK